jgi:hypothetical protein
MPALDRDLREHVVGGMRGEDVPQHVQALERANDVRCARAALKRSIADGRTDVSEVLLAPPSIVAKMALGELLMSQKGWGRVRSERFLRSAGLTEIKTLGNLTERQRYSLAALLTKNRSLLIGDLLAASPRVLAAKARRFRRPAVQLQAAAWSSRSRARA